jgi:hypothetical protein
MGLDQSEFNLIADLLRMEEAPKKFRIRDTEENCEIIEDAYKEFHGEEYKLNWDDFKTPTECLEFETEIVMIHMKGRCEELAMEYDEELALEMRNTERLRQLEEEAKEHES